MGSFWLARQTVFSVPFIFGEAVSRPSPAAAGGNCPLLPPHVSYATGAVIDPAIPARTELQ